jgi:hypothetical protein
VSEGQPSLEQACIFVIGMHRSGTSATTGTLASLGIAVPSGDDQTAIAADNERGNLESRSLRAFNDRLLVHLGGTWSGPPDLTPGWEGDTELDSWRARAVASFIKSFPSRPMAWKDPRNCITLPFWRTVAGPPVAAVFVYRDPVEVAGSLHVREGIGVTYGLALWDRYVRSACANLVGLPTMVADYARMLDEPAAWIRELEDFLRGMGIRVEVPSASAAVPWLAADLRHQHAPRDRPSGLWDSQLEIVAALRQLDGSHRSWSAPDLGPEPPWVDDLITLRRDTDILRREVERREHLLHVSRVSRMARFAGKLRHRRS